MCNYCSQRASASPSSTVLDPTQPCQSLVQHLRRLAAFREEDPWIIEEASGRVYDALVERIVAGKPPRRPHAWLFKVTHRVLIRLRRRREERPVSLDDLIEQSGDEAIRSSTRPQGRRYDRSRWVWVLARLSRIIRPICTSHEARVLEVIVDSPTIDDAANRCRMTPKEVDRVIQGLAAMARQVLARDGVGDRHLRGPGA